MSTLTRYARALIHLYYSNQTERLARALIERMSAAKADPDWHPLSPVPIVVPNRAVTAFLKQTIARSTGIAGNLEISFLKPFLTELVERAGGIKVADVDVLHCLLLSLLADEDLLAEGSLLPVKRYLFAVGKDEDAVDLRRFQLAQVIARHFEQYLLSRGPMLEAWQHGLLHEDTHLASVEGWQRALWIALQEKIAAEETDLVTLEAAFQRVDLAALELPPRMHFFAVSVAAPALQQILARIGERTELTLYALNPCLEFWEDVDAGFAARFRAMRSRLRTRPLRPRDASERTTEENDPLASDTPALRLWGRPGRENIRLLNELTECDFEARFALPEEETTLLGRFQKDVLLREPERTVDLEDQTPDDSIAVLACPGIRREVEVIASEIAALVQRHESLSFNDIAVVLTGRDQDTYRAHIGAVFREQGEIPHHLLDVPLRSTSRIWEAIDLLLALPFTKFTRQDLLRLITHPAVLARVVTGSDPDEWIRWCDELSILHGADHESHAGTYIEKDLYNWDQGLKRLVLGTFMTGQKSGDERRFASNEQHYLPFEYSVERMDSASRFIVLIRSLIEDVRYVRSERLTLTEWSELIRLLISSYIAAESDQDDRDLLRCLTAVEKLAEIDIDGRRVSFRLASELVRTALALPTSNVGQPFASGVMVAPLSLVHLLPFRVVFISGLGEGRFPTLERRSQLDLCSLARKPGDVSLREEDEYRFLEMILQARERLRLSYVSRDAQTGEELMPSPVVLELLEILGRGYLPAAESAEKRLVRRHPLRRYAGADAGGSVAARREAQTLRLRYDLEEHLAGPYSADARSASRRPPEGRALVPFPDLTDLERELSEKTWTALSRWLRLSFPEKGKTFERRGVLSVPFSALRQFLEDPLQGWARFVLGLREDDLDQDPYAREDELFSTSALQTTLLLREVLLTYLGGHGTESLEALYDEEAENRELLGILPTGAFGRAERKRHLEILGAWSRQVGQALAGARTIVTPIRFGRASSDLSKTAQVLSPLTLTVSIPGEEEPVDVEVQGTTEALIETRASIRLALRDAPPASQMQQYELRGFLDHVLLSAATDHAGHPFEVFVAFGTDGLHRVSFDSFREEEARSLLERILGELLAGAHDYLLPFATVLRINQQLGRDASPSHLAKILDRAVLAPFGPLTHHKAVKPSVPAALAIVKQRFGPYFAKRKEA